MRNMTNNTMYIIQELHTFFIHLKYYCKSCYLNAIPSDQYFHYILQIIYRLTFFCTYSF